MSSASRLHKCENEVRSLSLLYGIDKKRSVPGNPVIYERALFALDKVIRNFR